MVIEEGDPYLFEQLRAAGIAVEQKPEMYRFGELNVGRVRRILAGDTSPEPALPPGKPPALCAGCPHRVAFELLEETRLHRRRRHRLLHARAPCRRLRRWIRNCAWARASAWAWGCGTCCPRTQARRVVSVIGDSTFVHSGITGLVEMVYNPPPTGHVVLILDNGTTAMTGLQEHPGTGRTLGPRADRPGGARRPRPLVGHRQRVVIDPVADAERLEQALRDALGRNELSVIIARRPCLLAAAKSKKAEEARRRGGEGEEQGKRKAEQRQAGSRQQSPATVFLSPLPFPSASSSPAWAARAC